MPINKVASFDVVNRKQSFGAEDTKVKEASKPVVDEDDDDEEESFFERNKGILSAIGTIALVGVIGVVAHHQLKGKGSLKKGSKTEKTPKSHDVPHNTRKPDDKIDFDVWGYTYGLRSLGREEDVATSLKEMLPLHNAKTQIKIIDDLRFSKSDSGFPLLNSKSWESVFDTLTSIKTEDKSILKDLYLTTDRTVEELIKNGTMSPEIIDKLIAKMPNLPKEFKLLTVSNLLESHYNFNCDRVETAISPEQLKKLITSMNETDFSGFKWDCDVSYTISTECLPDKVKSKLVDKFITEAPLDKGYTDFVSEIIGGNGIASEDKLKFINDIHSRVKNATPNYSFAQEEQKKAKAVYEVLMKSLAEMDFAGFDTLSYSVEREGYNLKFVLGEKIVSSYKKLFNVNSDNVDNYIKFLDNFIDSAISAREQRLVSPFASGKPEALRSLMGESFRVRRDAFAREHIYTCSYDEAEKFVDDAIARYKKYSSESFHWGRGNNDNFSEEFAKIDSMIRSKLDGVSASDFNALRHNAIKEKIADFRRRTFGTSGGYDFGGGSGSGSSRTGSGSGYGRTGSSGSSSGGYSSDKKNHYNKYSWNSGFTGSVMRTKETQAKETLLKYLKEDENFKELARRLETEPLTEDLFKAVKRKLSLKYHTDRVAKESEEFQEKYKAIIQEILAACDVLEKSLKH